MSRVFVKTGREGPRHDPYAFEELTVFRPNGRNVTIHEGLANWAMDDRGRQVEGAEGAALFFTQLAGVTPFAARKAYQEFQARKFRYHPCGLKNLTEARGYPGESFVICDCCKQVLESHFDRSAIE